MSTTCPPLRCAERSADALARDSSFWELYGSSFEAGAREPAAAVIAAVRAGVAVALAAEDDDGRAVGLAIAHLLRAPPIVLVLYLAVAPELRGQRIGGTLLDQLRVVAADRQRRLGRTPRGWAAQIDLPELAPTKAEHERRRRVQLFLRARGARPLPVAYARPPLRGGTASAARLLHAPEGGLPLRREEAAALVRAIYFEKYAAVNAVDRRLLASLLTPAPRGAPIGVRIVSAGS